MNKTCQKVFGRYLCQTKTLEAMIRFSFKRFISEQAGVSRKYFHGSAVFNKPAHDAEFEEAKSKLNGLKEDPGNEVKLKLYALFKQATIGKNSTPKPGMMDMVGKVKWSAWNDLGDMSQDDAQKNYINVVNGLVKEESDSTSSDSSQSSSDQKYEDIVVTRQNKVFHIRLNRPKKKNALTWQMYADLGNALKEAAEDKNITVAVLTGTGDYYCSGNDLSNFSNITPDKIPQMAADGRDVLYKFVDSFIKFPKPLISLVNGHAVGISVTVLGLFDAVYCSSKTTFHTPFSVLGQTPEGCSSYVFPKLMGNAKANEMLIFNRKITAEEAKERNLISGIFPDEVFESESQKLIEMYATFPPETMQLSKGLIRSNEQAVLEKVNFEECKRLEERWQSKECISAIMKFFSQK